MSQTFREMLPGIWSWSRYDEERQIDFNGFYLLHGGEAVLVDPPEMTPEDQARFREELRRQDLAPLKAILLTNAHHERACAVFKKEYGLPVWIHELDAPLLENPPEKTFRDGDGFGCGLTVVHLQDQKTPGESAFWLAERRILLVGDALIGRVPGRVNLLPPDKFKDIDRARAGLKRLLDLDFESLLVGDGHCILQNARAVVAEFLSGQ